MQSKNSNNSTATLLLATLIGTTVEFFDFYLYGMAAVLVFPAAYIWGQVDDTINGLLNSVNTLKQYKQQYGNLDNYLKNFQDVDYYRNSPCFTAQGCNKAEKAALDKQNEAMSALKKQADDAAVKGMDQQFADLDADAKHLKELQANTQTSKGRMEALQYANQLASSQASQLMQIRALLLAQQDLMVKHMQVEDNKKAQERATDQAWNTRTDFSKWHFPPSNSWSVNPF